MYRMVEAHSLVPSFQTLCDTVSRDSKQTIYRAVPYVYAASYPPILCEYLPVVWPEPSHELVEKEKQTIQK